MRRRSRRALLAARIAIFSTTACALAGPTGDACADRHARVRIEAIEPSRTDSSLVCAVSMRGWPDPPSRETLESGLPCSVVLDLSLIDPSGTPAGGSAVEIRMEPDLWDGTLIMRTPFAERRAASIEEAAVQMERIGPIPVLPAARIQKDLAWRLRVRLAVHPLAPAETERIHRIFEGTGSGETGERREVSVGVGALVRYFLGRRNEETWTAEASSEPFIWSALPETP